MNNPVCPTRPHPRVPRTRFVRCSSGNGAGAAGGPGRRTIHQPKAMPPARTQPTRRRGAGIMAIACGTALQRRPATSVGLGTTVGPCPPSVGGLIDTRMTRPRPCSTENKPVYPWKLPTNRRDLRDTRRCEACRTAGRDCRHAADANHRRAQAPRRGPEWVGGEEYGKATKQAHRLGWAPTFRRNGSISRRSGSSSWKPGPGRDAGCAMPTTCPPGDGPPSWCVPLGSRVASWG